MHLTFVYFLMHRGKLCPHQGGPDLRRRTDRVLLLALLILLLRVDLTVLIIVAIIVVRATIGDSFRSI
ncbi:hypothetical protein OESDEN_22506 [Oesophagostomum dentatum]|uniref:Uncharacterized protein n=1 Tax=Oesophagostomum dentatum TaxID=61180 RepID=A0A0B1RYU7_OESDE|nr:hypothetical protein OESDEN_22506 [Oesophagostomum dentatum]